MRCWSVRSAFTFVFLVLALAGQAFCAEFGLTVEVPVGKLKSLRLRNLPEGAVVGVDVQTSGDIGVVFVRAKDPKDPPARVPPLFTARLERRLAFSVTVPSAGSYYVVFDNRKGEETRTVTLKVRAARMTPPRDRNAPSRVF
jgi:hypothetical protein